MLKHKEYIITLTLLLIFVLLFGFSFIPPSNDGVVTSELVPTDKDSCTSVVVEPSTKVITEVITPTTLEIYKKSSTKEFDQIETGYPQPSSFFDDKNNYNGYWWGEEGWVGGLVTLDTQFLRMPTVSMGSAVFYAPQAMEANIELRGLPYNEEMYVGSVALPFCSEIGHSVWIKHPDKNDWEGAFLVVDCSRRNDLYGHIMFRDQVVEIDFETAVRWNIARYTTTTDSGWMPITPERLNGVLVSTVPPEIFDGNIIDLSEWFPAVLRYAKITELYTKAQNYAPPGYDGTLIRGGLGVKNPSDTLPMWLINDVWTIFY